MNYSKIQQFPQKSFTLELGWQLICLTFMGFMNFLYFPASLKELK